MKVCVLGKADVPVCNLTGYLVEQGHEVHLVMGLREQDPPAGVIPHDFDFRGKTDILRAAKPVRRIVETIRPDVVHAFFLTSYGYLASRIPRVPVLATAMGTDVFGAPELSRLAAPLRAWLTRRAIRRADRIHSVAPHMTERLVRLGARAETITTFPRGISVRRFRARTATREPGPLRLLCNRRFEAIYDHPTLLRAAVMLGAKGVEYRMHLVGRGSLRVELERQAAEMGLGERVVFSDNVLHEEIPGLLQRTDLFLSASLSDGTSSCLLEAMASGCVPVIADIVANRAWIRDGDNGFLFRPGDPAALVHAIERATSDRERWTEIGSANRRFIEEHASMERGCEKVLEIYRDLKGSSLGKGQRSGN